MKAITDIVALVQEISAYMSHFAGLPLLVGFDNSEDYRLLLSRLAWNSELQIVRMSDECIVEFPPNPIMSLDQVGKKAGLKPVVWLGASQSLMLYGSEKAEKTFIKLAGSNVDGPIVLLCPYCCTLFESIALAYYKLGQNMLVLHNDQKNLPTIYFHPDETSCTVQDSVQGIQGLLRCLEDGEYKDSIHVITSCNPSILSSSLFPEGKNLSAFELLCQNEPSIASAMSQDMGTDAQWTKLQQQVFEAGSLSALCEKKLCSVARLPEFFPEYYISMPDENFLCFASLKAYYSDSNDYLCLCLNACKRAEEFASAIHNAILQIEPYNDKFNTYLLQRAQILKEMYSTSLMRDFCEKATIRKKDIVYYLTDNTEEERAALIHALCTYDYRTEEILPVLEHNAHDLFLYLQKFVFDTYNTKTAGTDSGLHTMLTDYFQQYKIQKITNRQDESFVALVEKEATARSFTKLQARSAIVRKLPKADSKPYFFDALGVEFLAYIEAKAKEYGMQCNVQIGHCNLPSITAKNKDFYEVFPIDVVSKEEGIDSVKHHGTKFDYRLTTEPLHIFSELEVINENLKKMSSLLSSGKVKNVIILSDHGASRLAVTYQGENDQLQLSEPGMHSGRCCPVDEDPHIQYATYEDGFAVLANYERFKGSRKTNY